MRKLLGYRLKREDYRKAASIIVFGNEYGSNLWYNDIETRHDVIDKLKKAGVMHWFEEVYEEGKLEVGKWYKWTGDNPIIGVLKETNNRGVNKNCYAFEYTIKGKIKTYDSMHKDYLEPATPEEIQQALIKEAKKRGFKEGVRVTRSYGCDEVCETKFSDLKGFKYDPLFNRIQCFGICIFDNGQWAEILPDNSLNGKTAIIDGVEYELKIK